MLWKTWITFYYSQVSLKFLEHRDRLASTQLARLVTVVLLLTLRIFDINSLTHHVGVLTHFSFQLCRLEIYLEKEMIYNCVYKVIGTSFKHILCCSHHSSSCCVKSIPVFQQFAERIFKRRRVTSKKIRKLLRNLMIRFQRNRRQFSITKRTPRGKCCIGFTFS